MPLTNGILDTLRLDPTGPNGGTFKALLANTQGNILKGHGRDHSVHLFLKFTGGKVECASATQMLFGWVTSTEKQLKETADFKEFGIPGGVVGNLAISASGYSKLGLWLPVQDPYFSAGMRVKGIDFNDPPASCLDPEFSGDPIDLVLMLADDDRAFLLRRVRDLVTALPAGIALINAEVGDVLRNDNDEGIEHFGYVDGRSQPLYLDSDVKDEIDPRTGANIDKWDPSEPLRRVLVPDPLAPAEAIDACGSLMVFRKLEQNVQAFKMKEQALATALGLQSEDRERAGAMVVGRFEDGTPLALSQVDGLIPAKDNNFTYANDAAGQKCPFHAHIRKTNPRGDTVRLFGATDEQERSHRVTRRAIPYGADLHKATEDLTLGELPIGDVGLLFVCFQASIENQFAFMQKSWANETNFVKQQTGIDPIIAQTPKNALPQTLQTWLPNYGAPSVQGAASMCPLTFTTGGPTEFDFSRFVSFKGGEFFFAPSIPFLANISAIVANPPPNPNAPPPRPNPPRPYAA